MKIEKGQREWRKIWLVVCVCGCSLGEPVRHQEYLWLVVCVCGCSLGEPVRHQEYFQTFFIYSNTKWAIFQLYLGQNMSYIWWDEFDVRFVLDQHTFHFYIVLAHWDNIPRLDMLLHWDTLFPFQANQSLLFLFNAACFTEKQQMPIS